MDVTPTAPPVFTIGHREGYVKELVAAQQEGLVLLRHGMDLAGQFGNASFYPGGIVFQNPKDARKYLNEEWPDKTRPDQAVFEVQASWVHDCYTPDAGLYWEYLLFSRPLTLLVEE